MASKKCIELFYDVVSPYSWFAFEGAGNKPPASVPAKAVHLNLDLVRLGRYFDVPLNIPADPADLMFVKGTLKAQRFLTALDVTSPDKVEDMSRELWMRGWSRDQDISEDASLAEAAEKIGLSKEMIQSILAKVKDGVVKERLKETTQEALDLGAYGSPIIVVDLDGKKEWVFGSDRFPVFAQMIGEKWQGPNPGMSSKL